MVQNQPAGPQVRQWNVKNKGKSSLTGASCFVLNVPLLNMRPSVADFIPQGRGRSKTEGTYIKKVLHSQTCCNIFAPSPSPGSKVHITTNGSGLINNLRLS